MLVLQSHQCLFSSTSAFSVSHRIHTTRFLSLNRSPVSISPISSFFAFSRTRPDRIRLAAVNEIADVADVEGEEEEAGPIELPPSASPFSSTNSIFATSDDPSPLQLATSVMLTGAITIFLFRSLRRRAKRSKELTFRSSGAKKSLKEEAMDNLKAMGSAPIEGGKSTPSAAQAFLGAVGAGVIALILYKFTLTIESSLNRQTISDNFSVSFFSLYLPIDHSLLVSKFLLLSIFALVIEFWEVTVPCGPSITWSQLNISTCQQLRNEVMDFNDQ